MLRSIARSHTVCMAALLLVGIAFPACSDSPEREGVAGSAVVAAPVLSFTNPPLVRVYQGNFGDDSVTITPTSTPTFTESLPLINFNPDPLQLGPIFVDEFSRPMIDVTLSDPFTPGGTVVLQGRAGTAEAGVGAGQPNLYNASVTTAFDLCSFQAGITGKLHASSAGDVVINVTSDDGFILGIKGGVTASPPPSTPPTNTPLTNAPVVLAFDAPQSPSTTTTTLHFPSAGDFEFELDYFESFGGQLQLLLTEGTDGQTVPPGLILSIAPLSLGPMTINTPETFTVTALDANGAPVSNGTAIEAQVRPFPPTPTAPQLATCTPTSAGVSTCQYTRTTAGLVTIQASAAASGFTGLSNVVTEQWN